MQQVGFSYIVRSCSILYVTLHRWDWPMLLREIDRGAQRTEISTKRSGASEKSFRKASRRVSMDFTSAGD
jgi:hypothetical protein